MQMTYRTFLLALLAAMFCFVACSKAPTSYGTLAVGVVRSELAPKVPLVFADDDSFAILDHAWTERTVYAWVASRWHDKQGYVAELKDCDDFTDDLVHHVRRAFREVASVELKGGAAVGPVDVLLVPPYGWHQIMLLRTERGWFVIDPQIFNSRTRTLDLIPLEQYNWKSRHARFGT